MSLTMLQAVAGGFRELGTTALTYLDPTAIDQALTHRAIDAIDASGDIELRLRIDHPSEIEDHRTRWVLLQHIRQLRHTLLTQERAPVLLPEPHPPAVLTHHDLGTAIQPLLDQLPTSVADLLTATDVDATQLHIVILHTNTALPGLQDHLATATQRPTTVITGHPHATADGAFLLTAPAGGRPTAATTRIARVRLRITDVAGAVIIGGCSLALLIQVITTAYTVVIHVGSLAAGVRERPGATAQPDGSLPSVTTRVWRTRSADNWNLGVIRDRFCCLHCWSSWHGGAD
jgi:hypothetical protein